MSNIAFPDGGQEMTEAAVAVSGGSDSMALLQWLTSWAKPRNITLHALTVDHGLRAESAEEAAQVGRWCEALGVPHTTLQWKHQRITSALQEQAREARYRLMIAWCHAHRISHLFTAHHQDDQIETFLFRLARGSGMEGLSGILPVSYRQGIFLHRPLLSFPKSQLVEMLKKSSQPWVEDPTNKDTIYTRNHLRLTTNQFDDETKNRISKLTESFFKFRKLLEYKLYIFLHDCFIFHDAGYGEIDARLFLAHSEEMRSRAIAHICALISGDAHPIRSYKIERALHALTDPVGAHKFVLHGVVFHSIPKNQHWLVYREKHRIAPRVEITAAPTLWDNRFLVEGKTSGLSVGALGKPNREILVALEQSTIPKPVWATLPALFHLEECVGVPHIQWVNGKMQSMDAQIRFVLAKLLADTPNSAMNQPQTLFRKEDRRA